MQPDLFPPAARTTDPGTSHAAAREHTEVGARRRHCDVILGVIEREPCLTLREIAARTPFDAAEVSKRLSDLHAQERIQPVNERRCSVSRRAARTWVSA